MVLDELADLMFKLHANETATKIARNFGRERKWVYNIECSTGFHLNAEFIAGLRHYGYELKLVGRKE